MNYQVIQDIEQFTKFVEWLPTLQVNEKYYLSLFGRKKYNELVDTDKANLKRFSCDKESMPLKVRQLECAVGSYIGKAIPIPQDALALYIAINPRSTVQASFQTIIELTRLIQSNQQNLNPHSVAMTQLHKSPARKLFVVFDVDRKEDLSDTISVTREIVGATAAKFLETRGGVHVIVELAKLESDHKNWFPELHKRIRPDQTGDLLIPVAGCCQGGFIPRFID